MTKHALLNDAKHTVSFELVRDESANFIVQMTLIGEVGKLYTTKKVFSAEQKFNEFWNQDLALHSIVQEGEAVLDEYRTYLLHQADHYENMQKDANNYGPGHEDYILGI